MTLQFFPAQSPNKTGVLVVPGGGYGFLALDHEGEQVARWLNERGFDAWVLSYTIASDDVPAPIYPRPQHEALRAIEDIRALNRVEKLGIFGFSAGGHLSAITLTDAEASLDFGILAYPVISMEEGATHSGSKFNLLGPSPSDALENAMSAHTRVTFETPLVFLFHTANDDAVPVQNSLLFASAMAEYGLPFELLILPEGAHGVGLALEHPTASWTHELEYWLLNIAAV